MDIRELVEYVRGRVVTSVAAHPVLPEDSATVLAEAPIAVAQQDWPELVLRVHDHVVGSGPIGPLLRDPGVTDVFVNGPREIWIDRGFGLERSDIGFADEQEVREVARRLAAHAGRSLDDAHPCVDAFLPSGQRLHAVIPPLSVRGTALSVRCFGARRRSLRDLVSTEMFDEQVCEILEALVRARRSLLVSGGTGSGKTTLVNALIHACDPADRIIIIEDTYELRPDHPHVVNLHARDSASAGSGALAALVRQALRIRPDRIVVGEVRGEEVVDLLTALNTGHVGAFSTVHANSASQVPQRLAFLAARTAISAVAIEHAVRDGIDAVVHLTRQPRRRVAEIAVTLRDSDQCLVPAWSSEVSIDAAAASRLAQLCES